MNKHTIHKKTLSHYYSKIRISIKKLKNLRSIFKSVIKHKKLGPCVLCGEIIKKGHYHIWLGNVCRRDAWAIYTDLWLNTMKECRSSCAYKAHLIVTSWFYCCCVLYVIMCGDSMLRVIIVAIICVTIKRISDCLFIELSN